MKFIDNLLIKFIDNFLTKFIEHLAYLYNKISKKRTHLNKIFVLNCQQFLGPCFSNPYDSCHKTVLQFLLTHFIAESKQLNA